MNEQTKLRNIAQQDRQRLSRDVPLIPSVAALLVVDMQNYTANRNGGEFRDLTEVELRELDYFFDSLEQVKINIRELQEACRANDIEVLYCVIENLTQDGRDRGLDYKITGFSVPKGSWEAKVIDELAPVGDEIVIGKTSSSVFNSTNIDYVLRSLGVKQLAIVGILMDQCVESAVRDACDLGYLVTLVTDACTTYSAKRQRASENALKGYCRQIKSESLLAEIGGMER